VIGGIIYAFSSNLVGHINSLTGINPTSNLGANMQGIIFGILLILTMLFTPRGIAGLGPRFGRLVANRRRVAPLATGE
jgi:ABC-type branched-subunit amino acid transport system permease subunit